MSTEIERHNPTELAQIPEKIGGDPVPRTVTALERFLEQNKNNKQPLAWRASALAVVDAQQGTNLVQQLYLLGGIDRDVSADHVLILGNKPYVEATGAVQVVIDRGGSVYAEQVGLFWCGDPESLCPEALKDEPQGGRAYVYRGVATQPGKGRAIATRSACVHTWSGARDKSGKLSDNGARFLPYMAETRAKRRAALDLLGWRHAVELDGEEPDDSLPGMPSPSPALHSSGSPPQGSALVDESDGQGAGADADPHGPETATRAEGTPRGGAGGPSGAGESEESAQPVVADDGSSEAIAAELQEGAWKNAYDALERLIGEKGLIEANVDGRARTQYGVGSRADCNEQQLRNLHAFFSKVKTPTGQGRLA